MSYVLVPQDDDATRLLLQVITRTPRWAAPALPAGDLIMARRQLLNLKKLAERHDRHQSPRSARRPGRSRSKAQAMRPHPPASRPAML
jgi:hypothetical protein